RCACRCAPSRGAGRPPPGTGQGEAPSGPPSPPASRTPPWRLSTPPRAPPRRRAAVLSADGSRTDPTRATAVERGTCPTPDAAPRATSPSVGSPRTSCGSGSAGAHPAHPRRRTPHPGCPGGTPPARGSGRRPPSPGSTASAWPERASGPTARRARRTAPGRSTGTPRQATRSAWGRTASGLLSDPQGREQDAHAGADQGAENRVEGVRDVQLLAELAGDTRKAALEAARGGGGVRG